VCYGGGVYLAECCDDITCVLPVYLYDVNNHGGPEAVRFAVDYIVGLLRY